MFKLFKKEAELGYPTLNQYQERCQMLTKQQQDEHQKDFDHALEQSRTRLKQAMWRGEKVFRVGEEIFRRESRYWSWSGNKEMALKLAKVHFQELKELGFNPEDQGWNDHYWFITIHKDLA